MNNEIKISEVQRLRLEKGDIVLLHVDRDLSSSDEAVAWLRRQAEQHFPDNKVMVLCPGIRIDIIDSASMAPACG